MTPRRVIFVGHDASRTGAPIVLLSLLRWLASEPRARGDAAVAVVLRRGGPLEPAYRGVAPTAVVEGAIVGGVGRVGDGLRSLAAGRAATPWSAVERSVLGRTLRRAGVQGADVVVANTLAALPLAALVAADSARLVCHVHELDHVADRVLPVQPAGGAPGRAELLARVDTFVAAGAAVAEMLTERFGIAGARVELVDAFVEAPAAPPDDVAAARRRLTGESGRPIVMAVGAMSRRKGPDRFVDLMATLVDHPARPLGVWLGGQETEVVWGESAADVARAGLDGSVHLLPSVDAPGPLVASADVVVSTAREDPFPLAVLEAAALGVPVVVFDSGGIGELLRAAGVGGHVLPAGDVLGMRAAVAGLLDDPTRAREVGETLSQHVRRTHLVDHLAPELWRAVVG